MRLVSLVFAALAGLAGAPVWAADDAVDRMAWLAGCWQGEGAEPGSIEQWMAPVGGTMLGMSRTVRKGKTVAFEFMQLRQLADGSLAYVPQPSGRPPVEFRLLQAGQAEAVFENPQHDFPQRISYARPEPARLVASIEGLRNGVARKIDFAFKRVSCDAALASPN